MFNSKKKAYKKFDYTLFLTTVLLCIYGLIMLYSATLSFKTSSYMKSQGVATAIGFILLILLVLLDYQFLGKLYIPIYVISNLLLVAVLIWGFGEDQWGARSWLKIGIVFQPSEFVKVGLIISLAKFIDDRKEDINEPITLLKILAFAFLPILLILRQPDAGTAMVFIFFVAAMLFIAGVKWKYIGYALLTGVLSLPILWFRLDTYQKNRFFNFLNPERDAPNTGYQAMQSKIAIGSGKVFGRGLLQGVYTQFQYIPVKESDFIFAVIAEELGFMGGLILIILYFIFLNRLVKIAKNSTDLFGSLMVIGFIAIFVFHIFENIAMNIGIMPITGIPLPFISHGGTFQLINLICVGIALSIGVHREELTF